jgi:hypothetical protein
VEQAEPAEQDGQQPDGDPAGDRVVVGRRPPEQGERQPGDPSSPRNSRAKNAPTRPPSSSQIPSASTTANRTRNTPWMSPLCGDSALREFWPRRWVRELLAAGRRFLAGAGRRVCGRRVRALANF